MWTSRSSACDSPGVGECQWQTAAVLVQKTWWCAGKNHSDRRFVDLVKIKPWNLILQQNRSSSVLNVWLVWIFCLFSVNSLLRIFNSWMTRSYFHIKTKVSGLNVTRSEVTCFFLLKSPRGCINDKHRRTRRKFWFWVGTWGGLTLRGSCIACPLSSCRSVLKRFPSRLFSASENMSTAVHVCSDGEATA